MIQLRKYFPIILLVILFSDCSKNNDNSQSPDPAHQLSYGDSIFYVQEGGNDKVVTPINSQSGTYTAFPDGIELDEKTGAINVNKSETGLRYRISFVPDGKKDTISTIVLLSGINYQDNIYSLEKHDTLAPPIYNGNINASVPGVNNNSFDDNDGCKSLGIEVDKQNGMIDLQSVIRNGVLGNSPSNGDHTEVDLLYRIDDPSNKSLNKVRVKFYYFDSPEDIDADLVQQMKDRKGMFIGMPGGQAPFFQLATPDRPSALFGNNITLAAAKPRPPCIFIVRRTSKI